MKKCILHTTLSALLFTLIGVVLALVSLPTLISGAITGLTDLLPDYWWFLLLPAFSLLLLLLLVVFKLTKKVKGAVLPLVFFLSILAFLLVAPRAFLGLLNSITNNVPPGSLVFTVGAGLIALSHVLLLVLALVDFFKTLAHHKEKNKEVDEEEYEPIVEEHGDGTAPVEFIDEEREDEVGLEEESVGETEERKKEAKKDKNDRIYHVMKRAKDDRWIVKIAKSRKAIKIFDTQKEAIRYAEVLAGNNDGVVRVFASKGANKGRIIV